MSAPSVILKQIEEMKEAAKASAEWNNLVSVEEVAEKTRKTIPMVKELLKNKGVEPKYKLGKSYLYSKKEILEAIRYKD